MANFPKFFITLCAMALAIPGFSVAAEEAEDASLEEVIVTGFRGKPRSSTDSAVPIDTFTSEQIDAISHTDTTDILQTLVPSYNVSREPISDGPTFIRQATLRGLPSHHTLVLVNGKRRHRASLVRVGGDGTQGPDVATIPSTALQSIEVLRDGASSQYGSDAIAGVINFNLKENNSGGSLLVNSGEYYEGDGFGYTIAGNIGLPLGDNGFLSISAEIDEQDFTERSHQYCESWFCADPANPIFGLTSQLRQGYVTGTPTPGAGDYINGLQQAYPAGRAAASVQGNGVQPWGQPNVQSTRLFYNAGLDLDNGSELYSFGSYSESEGDGSFFYRYPGNGTIEVLRNSNGSFYSPLEKFPGGFTPRFTGEVEDYSIVAGFRGGNDNGFTYDVSGRYGFDEIAYTIENTVNPSYGIDSPTKFKPGTLSNSELQLQIDLSNEFDMGGASTVVLAYGVSYQDEEYDVQQSSDLASYDAGPHAIADPFGFCSSESDFSMRTATTTAGGGVFGSSVGGQAAVAGNTIAGLDCTDSGDAVYQVVGVGSNGFPGYSPAFSEKYSRDSYAVYADVSTDVSEQLFLQAAARYEDYSDFGAELVGKIAGIYRVNENFAIRGSFGSGFRAPTPGQQGTTNVSTRLPQGLPVATGLFPASGSVAQALGASDLKAETSTSFTLGLTADFGELTLTADLYQIDIADRFRAISTLTVSTDPTSGGAYDNFLALQAAGVAGANTIGGVFYFQNAIDTTTTGLDIVASYPMEWGNGHSTSFQLAFNYNKSELDSDSSDFLNEEDQYDFEHNDPQVRWNLTANHEYDDFSLMLRGRYYGKSENSNTSGALVDQKFKSVFFVDVAASYAFGNGWRAEVGGRNVFDTFPDKTSKAESNNDQCCGRDYVSGGVVPWQGGYYYGRISVAF